MLPLTTFSPNFFWMIMLWNTSMKGFSLWSMKGMCYAAEQECQVFQSHWQGQDCGLIDYMDSTYLGRGHKIDDEDPRRKTWKWGPPSAYRDCSHWPVKGIITSTAQVGEDVMLIYCYHKKTKLARVCRRRNRGYSNWPVASLYNGIDPLTVRWSEGCDAKKDNVWPQHSIISRRGWIVEWLCG